MLAASILFTATLLRAALVQGSQGFLCNDCVKDGNSWTGCKCKESLIAQLSQDNWSKFSGYQNYCSECSADGTCQCEETRPYLPKFYCNNCKKGTLFGIWYNCKCTEEASISNNKKRNAQRECVNAKSQGGALNNKWFENLSDCVDNKTLNFNKNRLKVYMCNGGSWKGNKGVWQDLTCQLKSKLINQNKFDDARRASWAKECNWCKMMNNGLRMCDCEPNYGDAPYLCNDCKWDNKNQYHWGCECMSKALVEATGQDTYADADECKACTFKPRMDGKPWRGICDCSDPTPEPAPAPVESACKEYCGEGVTWDEVTKTCVGVCEASQEWPGCGILGGLPNKDTSTVVTTDNNISSPCDCETACSVVHATGWFYDRAKTTCECFSNVEFKHHPGMKENNVIGVVN